MENFSLETTSGTFSARSGFFANPCPVFAGSLEIICGTPGCRESDAGFIAALDAFTRRWSTRLFTEERRAADVSDGDIPYAIGSTTALGAVVRKPYTRWEANRRRGIAAFHFEPL